MTRQSISLSKKNDDWLRTQVSNDEYSSKSEAVNDLIRRERKREEEITILRQRLIKAESSRMIKASPAQIKKEAQRRLNDAL